LAVALDRATLALWDLHTGKERRRLPKQPHETFCTAFSPDGRLLALGNWDSTIRLYHAATGKELGHLKGHQGHVNALSFSSDGKVLASGSSDTSVLLCDMTDFVEQR